MDFTHPEMAFQARTSALRNTLQALRKVYSHDPHLIMQLFLTLPVVAACMVFSISAIQWLLVILVTILFVAAGTFRTAALLQVKYDSSLTPFLVSRIKCVGNMLVTLTAGISLLTYMLVFVPLIGRM